MTMTSNKNEYLLQSLDLTTCWTNHLIPINFQITVFCQEPLPWNSGTLTTSWENQGPSYCHPSRPANLDDVATTSLELARLAAILSQRGPPAVQSQTLQGIDRKYNTKHPTIASSRQGCAYRP